jgi:hypothetical protein
MQHLQQVMCQRFAQSLRISNQVLRMTQEAARSDCRSDLPTWMRPDKQCQIVRSERLTFHATAEFDPELTARVLRSGH